MKNLKQNRAITLVALIVTIIILLILAGVAIAQLTGNGLFEKSKKAASVSERATIEEQITLTQQESLIKKMHDQTTSRLKEVKVASTQEVNLRVADTTSALLNIDGTPGGTVLSDIAYSLNNNEVLTKIANKTSSLNAKLNDEDITLTVGDNYVYTVKEDSYTFLGTKEQVNGGGKQGSTAVDITDVKTTEGQAVQALSTTEITMVRDKSETPVEIPVPAGYGIAYDTALTVDFGIVIEDTTGTSSTRGNQFVWVPVDNPSEMYVTIDPTELGGSGKSGVMSNKRSDQILTSSQFARSNIGSMGNSAGNREPDIVGKDITTAPDGKTHRGNAGYSGDTAIFDFATDLSDSYKSMIESVEYYKGFYIGRYEITGALTIPTEKSGWAITGTSSSSTSNYSGSQEANWYKLYKTCKYFGNATNRTATSRMVWGCQWDEICNFISSKGDKKVLEEFKNFGNYKDNIVKDNNRWRFDCKRKVFTITNRNYKFYKN